MNNSHNRVLSLRDLNFAKTRDKILKAFLKSIKRKPFDEVTVDEICYYAEISKGTFFNYFPTKDHVYTFYGWIFCNNLMMKLKEEPYASYSCRDKIREIFIYTMEEEEKYPGMFSFYLSHILRRHPEIIYEVKYTRADLLYKFPEMNVPEDITVIHVPTVAEILADILREGIAKGEFSPAINIRRALLMLLSILLCPPLTYKFLRESYNLEEFYYLFLDNIMEYLLTARE